MKTWQELTQRTDSEWAKSDIAEVNLACAAGLPGAEAIDGPRCLQTLDDWAKLVLREIARSSGLFARKPEEYQSYSFFCALCMVTVLQRDCGVRYNLEMNNKNDHEFFSNAENLFIHAVIEGKGGACTSLPPLYVAIGRRLGWPLKLVQAKRHLFARWDEPDGERFNIECTSPGFVSHSDAYYLSWPMEINADEIGRYCFLKSLTPREELASFLCTRGVCWEENQQDRQAVEAFAWAGEMQPDNHGCSHLLVNAMNRWDEKLQKTWPPHFPPLEFEIPQRQFPSLPIDLENGIHLMETMDDVLRGPLRELSWMEGLCRDPDTLPPGIPARIVVRYSAEAGQPQEFLIQYAQPQRVHDAWTGRWGWAKVPDIVRMPSCTMPR